jgi:hypothetical protein
VVGLVVVDGLRGMLPADRLDEAVRAGSACAAR